MKKKFGWGGARPGAGRKPNPNRKHPYVPHRKRDRIDFAKPIRVVARAREDVPKLTQQRVARLFAEVIDDKKADGAAIASSKIDGRAIEIVVRAKNATELRYAVQAVMIAFARRLNTLLGRSGKVWADRYHVVSR